MQANWPLNEERLPILIEYRKLFDLVGEERFRAGVQNVLESTTQFFPSIGQFRTYLPNPPVGERTWWRDPNCPKCHGTGWFYVRDHEANRLYGRTDAQAVLRCREPNCLHRK